MADEGAITNNTTETPTTSLKCSFEECTVVCPANLTVFRESLDDCGDTVDIGTNQVTLKFLTANFGDWIKPKVKEFSQNRNDVNVDLVIVSLAELSPNIINEARSKTGLFDGFITPPGVMGSIVEDEGWADLRPYIDSNSNTRNDWTDIFLSYRKWISQYQDQILMYPLDGDVLSLFYRQDVLDDFDFQMPRTWEEYNTVAAATHGKVYKNQTLIGSCIGRVKGCAGPYWANLVLSSMTQFGGTEEGHLFDTKDMTPLLGEAFEKMLQLMEIQARYGPGDEFDDCVDINSDYMNNGSCVLTYNWGNTFKTHLNSGSVFQQGKAEMSVCATPGSTHVLDHDTMKLVPCNKKLCRFATFYEDIGWVNRAPYLAFGGWSCAVNNYTTPGKKDLANEFCAFASSKEESNEIIAEQAATAVAGSDPFRLSHLDIALWTSNGYDRDSVAKYFDVLETALESGNAVVDIRFPTSSQIYATLDEEVHNYLNETANGKFTEETMSRTRKEISERLGQKFLDIIYEYDSQASTRVSVLEQYQKLRNVYKTNNTNLNQLGSGIRGYGFAIASLTMVLAWVFALWSYKHRFSPVVKASQPFFLILICLGVFVLASSIFPMAIDDGFASVEACDKACMSIPWLITMGWSILFAALYAKLRRVNLVIRNAMAFRSIKVSEKDVMLPFAVLFTSNLILMTIWTVLDPLVWMRTDTTPTESYGACKMQDTDSAAWKVIISVIAVFNGAALIGANLEAYRARNVDTEFGESSYIGLIMVSFLQVVAVGLPLFFLVSDNPTAGFFLTSSMVFLMSISVLLLLFIPKWRTVRMRQNQLADSGNGRVVISRFATSPVQSEDVSTVYGNNRLSAQVRYNEAAWIERVKNLESALEEAGINPKPYFRQADIIGTDDEIMSVNTSSMALNVPMHIHMARSAVESSMIPLSEAIRDDTNNEESNHGDLGASIQAVPESCLEDIKEDDTKPQIKTPVA